MTEQKRGIRKSRVGIVLSDKMQKTRVVGIERRVKHLAYGKYLTRTTKLMVDDREDISKKGDKVRIVESRPLSRHKRWRLVEVVKKAVGGGEVS